MYLSIVESLVKSHEHQAICGLGAIHFSHLSCLQSFQSNPHFHDTFGSPGQRLGEKLRVLLAWKKVILDQKLLAI